MSNERITELSDDHKERLVDALAEGTRIGDAGRRVGVPIPLVREWLESQEGSKLALERQRALLRITAPAKILTALEGALEDKDATAQQKIAAATKLSELIGLRFEEEKPVKKKKKVRKQDAEGRLEAAIG